MLSLNCLSLAVRLHNSNTMKEYNSLEDALMAEWNLST